MDVTVSHEQRDGGCGSVTVSTDSGDVGTGSRGIEQDLIETAPDVVVTQVTVDGARGSDGVAAELCLSHIKLPLRPRVFSILSKIWRVQRPPVGSVM